jgi:hypothetical protein
MGYELGFGYLHLGVSRRGITMICNYVCYDEPTWMSHDENDIIL